MDFKQYRIDRKMTQAQAGALIGMSASFWGSLEMGKEGFEKERAFARILTYLDDPRLQLPLTKERLVSVKGYSVTQQEASDLIGAGRNTWSNLIYGHCAITERWTRLCNALLIELQEKERELKKQAELDLLPSGDIEIVQPTVLTPTPETDVQPWNPPQPNEPVYVKMADWIAENSTTKEPEISDQGLIPFAYGQSPVRCKMVDGEPWWVLRDVCGAIGYKWAGDAVDLIEEEDLEKIQTLTPGGYQNMIFVNEPGLYQLLARTRAESAKPFQRWLFKEVLPQIRKTGQYSPAPAPAQVDPLDAIIMSLTEIKAVKAQQAQLAATIEAQALQIAEIKQQAPVDTDKAVNQTLQKLQSLEARRNELHNLVAQVVNAADRSKHIIASSYCSYQAVWRAVFNASNPPVNKLAGYTSLAQINTGIEAAKQLLETLLSKAPAEQLKIEIEGDAA
jgi:prophage antirepressor-like protein